MQSSIFDIFGDESRGLPLRQQTARQSSSHVLKGPGIEYLSAKSINVADYPSKNALGDIGNTKKKNKPLQEKTRPSNDQENASSHLLSRTPLQKAKLSIQTPNVRPVVRSPLSDLHPKLRPLVPVFQEPTQKVQAINSNLEKIDDFINDNFVESSFWDSDDISPKGPGIENLSAKSINVADYYPSKSALGDIGNTQKKNKALQEKTRPSNDQENASSHLLSRTPLQKAKLSIQTPNVRPVVRSPLSDLHPKLRPLVPVFQEPTQKVQAINSHLEKIDDFINGNFVESSFWDSDDISPKEDYTDILPKSAHRSDAEIYKLVNFWEMSKVPVDLESDEDVAVEDSSDYLFGSASSFDLVLDEPFSVPVVSDDDL